PMPGGERWSWTEAYGMLSVAPETAHGEDWERAWRAADAALEQILPRKELEDLHARCESCASAAPEEVLDCGAGRGGPELRGGARNRPRGGLGTGLARRRCRPGADPAPEGARRLARAVRILRECRAGRGAGLRRGVGRPRTPPRRPDRSAAGHSPGTAVSGQY